MVLLATNSVCLSHEGPLIFAQHVLTDNIIPHFHTCFWLQQPKQVHSFPTDNFCFSRSCTRAKRLEFPLSWMDFHLKTRGMIYNTWERTGVCMVWHGLATPSIQEFHLQQGCLDMFPSVQCRMVCTERRGVSGIRDAWRGQHWLKLTANKQREKTLYQSVPDCATKPT